MSQRDAVAKLLQGGAPKQSRDPILIFVAKWARARGIRRPENPAQMQGLIAQCMQEIGAGWDEVGPREQDVDLVEDGAKVEIVEPRYRYENRNEVDDFNEIVDKREAAMELAEGDDLHRDFIVQENEKKLLRKDVEWVNPNPPSMLDCSMGSTVLITPNGVNSDNGREAARWTGKPSETREVTVVLTPAALPIKGTAAFRPFATLIFGGEGWGGQAEVDIGLGTQVVVSCSFIAVKVSCENNVATGQDNLAASIGFGSAQRTLNNTRTRYIDALSQGTNTTVAIPAFAKDLMVLRTAFAESLTLDFLDRAGNVVGTQTLAASTVMTDPVRLPGDALQVKVTEGGVGSLTARLIFGLSV